MRGFLLALLLAGCGMPCPAGEDLSTWHLTGAVTVDPVCPSRASVHLGGTAYIEKAVPGPVSAEAVAADPAP